MSLFRRRGGRSVARLGPDEVALLRLVANGVLQMLDGEIDGSDPVLARLFPAGYRDDPAQAEQFRRYTQDDLRSAKLDQARSVLATLPAGGGAVIRLDPEAAELWLRTLNDARLALGVRLAVTDDTDLAVEIEQELRRDRTSVRLQQLSIYEYLGVLQESLLDSMSA